MTPAEARALLGVSPDDGPEVVRATHRRLIGEAHPDRHDGSEEATNRSAQLNEAWRVLRGDAAHTPAAVDTHRTP
ncbi:MAG: J domain-containing protein, partial [Acidimicrobiales bacterium]